MINYIEYGDIFDLPYIHCYAHGCNCAGTMGKGIALQFKNKYPEMYLQYKKKCIQGEFKLGDIFEYQHNNDHIFNLGTQKDWRTKANSEALRTAVYKMLESATKQNIKAIAMPKIGAGLGGLPWEKVKTILEELSLLFPNINLIVVENYKKASSSNT